MVPQRMNAVNGSEQNTWREMFPWLTVLLVFLCLSSFWGESSEAKSSLAETFAAAAAAVPMHSSLHP